MDYTRTDTYFYFGIYSFYVLLYYSQLNFLIYILLVYVIISKLRVDASRSRIGFKTEEFQVEKWLRFTFPLKQRILSFTPGQKYTNADTANGNRVHYLCFCYQRAFYATYSLQNWLVFHFFSRFFRLRKELWLLLPLVSTTNWWGSNKCFSVFWMKKWRKKSRKLFGRSVSG